MLYYVTSVFASEQDTNAAKYPRVEVEASSRMHTAFKKATSLYMYFNEKHF